MTYKRIRKIQVYILIALACFIFTKNFHLIFFARNIAELDQKNPPKIIFLPKVVKNESKPNQSRQKTSKKPENGLFLPVDSEYIKDKQKESASRQAWLFDNHALWPKRLIASALSSCAKVASSVKFRYLLGQKRLQQWRDNYLKTLEGTIGARGLPLAKGILFGDVSGIDRDTYHSFKVIGILHILSASSANFTIFLQFTLFCVAPIWAHFGRKQKFAFSFLVVFTYFILVGTVASTLRAFLTLSLSFVAAFILQRTFLPLFSLCVVAAIILAIDPSYLLTLGFQLSFLASFGIIFLYNYLEKEPLISKNYLLKSILLTFCAQFYLIPVLIYNFAELNYLAIVANLLVLPVIEILTVLFLISFVASLATHFLPLMFFKVFLSFLISKMLDILFMLINILEQIPWNSFHYGSNKEQFTMLFIVINLLSILWLNRLKAKRYHRDKYRILS